MSRGGRNYIHGDVEYRGVIHETGTQMRQELVYDETAEELADRRAAWIANNERQFRREPNWMAPSRRKSHLEDRGLEPYEHTSVRGPYATIGPARRAAGTGRGNSSAIETGTRHDGGTFTKVRRVEIGRVTWTPLDEEPSE